MKLRDLCEEYGIRFKKSLGQNLLLDDNINRIMVDAAGLTGEQDVVEVGAGLGALTDKLRTRARRMLAIEIDASFMPCLEDRFGDEPHVHLFRGDILNHPLDKLVKEFIPDPGPVHMVSNLPYYITTPILFHFWEADLFVDRMVVMVQAEVGQRMAAPTGSAEYGVLALASHLYADVDIVHHVPRQCFTPMPKVDSAIVRMRNRREPRYPNVPNQAILRVVRAAFAQRRKTLRNSLAKSGALGKPPEDILEAMERAAIDPSRRPQTLTLDEFAHLAEAIQPALAP